MPDIDVGLQVILSKDDWFGAHVSWLCALRLSWSHERDHKIQNSVS